MIKKIICLGVILVIFFSLAACNNDFNLEDYKENAKAEIQVYAYLGQGNYLVDNWLEVLQIASNGKTTVAKAENKVDVDTAVKETKDAIDEVEKEENNMLNDERITQIKQSAIKHFPVFQAIDEIYFYYYGAFNGSFVIILDPGGGHGRQAWHDIYEIYYPNLNYIRVWNNDNFYSLTESLDLGLLSSGDLSKIAEIHEIEFKNIYYNNRIWI